MPKRKLCYAVRIGRYGPMIYHDWDSASKAVNGFPGARFKGFQTVAEAEAWISDVMPQIVGCPSNTTTPPTIPVNAPEPPRTPDVVKQLPPTSDEVKQSPGLLSSPGVAENAPETRTQSDDEQHPSGDMGDMEDTSVPSDTQAPPSTLIPEAPKADHSMEVEATRPPKVEVILSDEQQTILDLVVQGKSVFYTGSAGTGKTVLLREMVRKLRDLQKHVAVTASTGIASVHIGGCTLHSFAGAGLGNETTDKLYWKVYNQKDARHRWRQTQTLIIDEISMIDGVFLDKLEHIARKIRDNDAPFGGIQLVICGDFYQLPPVPDTIDGVKQPKTFAFEAECWDKCMPNLLSLTKVFRQKDGRFVSILNEMRVGNLSSSTVDMFKQLSREVTYAEDLKPTELFALRSQAEDANMYRLRALPLPQQTFVALDFPGFDSKHQRVPMTKTKQLLDRLVAVEKLVLRIGAQVMLIKNLKQGRLVNGSVGRVIAFEEIGKSQFEVAKEDNNRKDKDRLLHRVELENAQSTNPEHSQAQATKWPVVQFESGPTLLCVPVSFTVENSAGRVEAQRDQVPLILAWALSIHKSQGQTLPRVKVNLRNIFEKGQAYVALSRATSLETLQVLNFQPGVVRAPDQRVIAFSKRLVPVSSLERIPISTAEPSPVVHTRASSEENEDEVEPDQNADNEIEVENHTDADEDMDDDESENGKEGESQMDVDNTLEVGNEVADSADEGEDEAVGGSSGSNEDDRGDVMADVPSSGDDGANGDDDMAGDDDDGSLFDELGENAVDGCMTNFDEGADSDLARAFYP